MTHGGENTTFRLWDALGDGYKLLGHAFTKSMRKSEI